MSAQFLTTVDMHAPGCLHSDHGPQDHQQARTSRCARLCGMESGRPRHLERAARRQRADDQGTGLAQRVHHWRATGRGRRNGVPEFVERAAADHGTAQTMNNELLGGPFVLRHARHRSCVLIKSGQMTWH